MSTRRDFVTATLATGTALLLETPLNAAAMSATEPQLMVVDLNIADACHFVAGCRTLALTGDSVRFAREVFAPSATEIIGGITTYADFVVLTGCAAEAGYRLISERAEGTFMRWKVARLAGAGSRGSRCSS